MPDSIEVIGGMIAAVISLSLQLNSAQLRQSVSSALLFFLALLGRAPPSLSFHYSCNFVV